MAHGKDIKIICGNSNRPFAEDVSRNIGVRLGSAVVSTFSDGEIAVSLDETETRKCKHGAPCGDVNLSDGTYRFYGPDNEFLLLGEVVEQKVRVIKRFFNP